MQLERRLMVSLLTALQSMDNVRRACAFFIHGTLFISSEAKEAQSRIHSPHLFSSVFVSACTCRSGEKGND